MTKKGRLGLFTRPSDLVHLKSFFFNSGSLSSEFSQVVQPRPPHLPSGYDFNFINEGRMKRKYLFHTDAVGYLSDREGGPRISLSLSDDDPLKYLNSLLLALFDLGMDFHGVTRSKIGNVHAHLFLFQHFQNIHHIFLHRPFRDNFIPRAFQSSIQSLDQSQHPESPLFFLFHGAVLLFDYRALPIPVFIKRVSFTAGAHLNAGIFSSPASRSRIIAAADLTDR